ncbi:HD domain-containing protein [Aquimarina litoralis]|uniref:HD domain-containing protein n=1 Tax=Aquimarina litoralis TaxID=584605 RepID=UPI001C576BED|nr:hypothetical protein [Aquimarina litoralis]MBW1298460.1 hypothetical protein [Aquimarina litoralis]
MLKEVFIQLVSKYTNDSKFINTLWNQIDKKHRNKNRYYHNLSHLENVYQKLLVVQDNIADWDIILFSIFYHDYIYNVLKKDNEEQSALKVKEILELLGIDSQRIELCTEIIIATKGHQVSKTDDINYFTDADLSILGSSWKTYKTYYEQVRKEYKYYPSFMYNKGRIQVLKHFLEMPRIFKTDYFYNNFEIQAKENLQHEIEILSK